MHFKLLSLKTYLKLSFYYIHTEKSMPFHKVFYSCPTINFYDWNPWYAPKQQWKVAWMPTSGARPCCPERQQFCCSEKKELCQVLPHCSPALLMQAVKMKQKKSENRFIIKERGKKMFLSSCSFSSVNGPLPSFLSAVKAVLSCALTSGMGCTIGHGSQGQQVTWRSAVYKCICFKWFHSWHSVQMSHTWEVCTAAVNTQIHHPVWPGVIK